MLNVVIDRKKWGQFSLRDSISGKMCCMGFASKAAGYAPRTLVGKGMVCDILNDGGKIKPGLEKLVRVDKDGDFWDDTPIAAKLAEVNDSAVIGGKEKEKTIIKLGKKVGIKFSFIN